MIGQKVPGLPGAVAFKYDGSEYTTYNLYGDGYTSSEDPINYAGGSYISGYYIEK